MNRNAGEALSEFWAVQEQGHLAAAVSYLDIRTNAIGLCAAGIPLEPDGIVTELAFSESIDDRAAAAIMACTNVARATEHQDGFRRCVRMTRAPSRPARRPVRVFATQFDDGWQESLSTFLHVALKHSSRPG